jgi:putative membrane protein
MTTLDSPPADTGTRLAVDRTRLAYERTMMAWVRTAMSMISFGFTIYKFFQAQAERGPTAVPRHFLGPREFALIMIGTALVALVLSALEHRQAMQTLRASFGPQPRSVSAAVAGIVALLGVLAFVSALVRG